jgi:3-dehydroquinate synthetase
MENAEIILREDMWLLKAILWAADLKRVCLEIDVEENENGSRRILRGGHGFSDRLEESVHFSIPHGLAVAVGIMMELQEEKAVQKLSEAAAIFDTYGIPTDLDGCRRLLVESQAGG